jgi:hypothetical protein
MNRALLSQRLQDLGIRSGSYSLENTWLDEAYILTSENGKWVVYYSERGLRSGLKQFDSEEEACEFMYRVLAGDPTVQR